MTKVKSNSKKSKLHNQQTNQYDKILRENLEAALPGLIRNLLGIHARYTEELPDDIQHTKERKPDVLKKVTDTNDETFVLHIELQVKDEREMAFRMAEYYIMLLRKYQLRVRQYVIYIGATLPLMKDHIHSEQMKFKYRLIALSAVDYHLLLSSDKPEEKMLAILANFGEGNHSQAIESIVKQVIDASEGDFSKQRHIQQLRILAQLRNLEPEIESIMDSIAGLIKPENDIFYKYGVKKGKEPFVKYLLGNTKFTISKIASLAEVTEDFVRKVKKSLTK
jgi:hypothetical protein